MSYEPIVNRQIPEFPILFNVFTIPPIQVELSVSESKHLSRYIQPNLQSAIEPANPYIETRYG